MFLLYLDAIIKSGRIIHVESTSWIFWPIPQICCSNSLQKQIKCMDSKRKELGKEDLLGLHGMCQGKKEAGHSADGPVQEGVPPSVPTMDQHSIGFCRSSGGEGVVNIRSRRKSWILVYVCRNTKAVCLLATSGYSTADFLCKHEEFVARKNRPKSIVSDRGSQLVRAGMTLAEKEKPVNWKWEDVVRNNSATNWEFVPVGSQHRNGLPESMVKILKRCLHLALPAGIVLKYSELVTLLAKISHCVNSRPIGLGSTPQDSQQEDFMSPITPNQLLLGKTDDEAPPLEYEDDDRLTARLAYVSGVYDTWWKSWYQRPASPANISSL